MTKTTVLLVNLGSPKNPKIWDVSSYLSEFLTDKRVIDLPYLFRKILVNLFIVPFRSRKTARLYKQIWTENGSPLLAHSEQVKILLQKELGKDFKVELAMRYPKKTSLTKTLQKIQLSMPKKLVVLPMYPHYASSTTGSVLEKASQIISKWEVIPELKLINQFFTHNTYLEAIADQARKHELSQFDHFIFSYHSLPLKHLHKIHPRKNYTEPSFSLNSKSEYCYQDDCYTSSNLLAQKLQIAKKDYTVAFQSQLNKNWLSPFLNQVLIELAKKGNKNILIFTPSFVADCLETTIEVGIESKKLFQKYGGEQLVLVASLNHHPKWIQALKELVVA